MYHAELHPSFEHDFRRMAKHQGPSLEHPFQPMGRIELAQKRHLLNMDERVDDEVLFFSV